MANHETGRDADAEGLGAGQGSSRKSTTPTKVARDARTDALRRAPDAKKSRHLIGSQAVPSDTKKSGNSVRTAVALSQEQVVALAAMGKRRHLSRPELVRQAVAEFLARQSPAPAEDAAFGLWRARQRDGLHYQVALRSEWDS